MVLGETFPARGFVAPPFSFFFLFRFSIFHPFPSTTSSAPATPPPPSASLVLHRGSHVAASNNLVKLKSMISSSPTSPTALALSSAASSPSTGVTLQLPARMFVGSCGALLTALIVSPLDVVKVRQQAYGATKTAASHTTRAEVLSKKKAPCWHVLPAGRPGNAWPIH